MLIGTLFWLSVALIPLAIWLHRWLPPLNWSNTSAANTSGSWLFGLGVIAGRFLLQLPLVILIALHPAGTVLPPGLWMVLVPAAFIATEAGLAALHTGWMHQATGPDRHLRRSTVRLLALAYFAALLLESTVIGRLVWSGGNGA